VPPNYKATQAVVLEALKEYDIELRSIVFLPIAISALKQNASCKILDEQKFIDHRRCYRMPA